MITPPAKTEAELVEPASPVKDYDHKGGDMTTGPTPSKAEADNKGAQ